MLSNKISDETTPSLTEWLEKAGFNETEKFRTEDNSKRDRLEILFQEIGLPYDRPERMLVRDIEDNTVQLQDIVARVGNKKCAFRLIPLRPDLPKMRERGLTLNEYLNGWYKTLRINPDDYKAEVVPHSDTTLLSAIFVVDDNGIWGNLIADALWQLSQGTHPQTPIAFSFDFNQWKWSEQNTMAQKFLFNALVLLKISPEKQKILANKLNAKFTKDNILKGYFEFVVWPEVGILFIDYNRHLGKLIGHNIPKLNITKATNMAGICASPGTASGKVKIVLDPHQTDFNEGEILVCPMTMVNYVPLMKKAAAIVTEQGNLLSHATIVARELGKPCLVGVKNATKVLKDEQSITVDADNGTIVVSSHC